jgi:hypothetical protein
MSPGSFLEKRRLNTFSVSASANDLIMPTEYNAPRHMASVMNVLGMSCGGAALRSVQFSGRQLDTYVRCAQSTPAASAGSGWPMSHECVSSPHSHRQLANQEGRQDHEADHPAPIGGAGLRSERDTPRNEQNRQDCQQHG